MTLKRSSRITSSRLWLAALGCLGLTACPLTDKYYIEQDSVGGNRAEGGGFSGAPFETGGAGTSSSLAAGGIAGASGSVPIECSLSNCEGTCCDDACVDLQSDPANCGRCGNACPQGRLCRSNECYGWTAMSPPPAAFVPREKAAYAALGENKLLIFGGLDDQGNTLNSGAIYDVSTDSWTLLPQTENVPSPRQLATAAWTGLRVFVMGGRDAASTVSFSDGARYDPETNTWLPLPSLPSGRAAPWAMPASNYILLWGGLSASGAALSGGERYVYGGTTPTASWTNVAMTMYSPDRVTDAAWGTTETLAYLFGGRIGGTTISNKGFLYTTSSNGWSNLPPGPSARFGAFGTCDGTAFFLWGGRDDVNVKNDGYRYGAAWTSLDGADAPSSRWASYRRTGWAFAFGTGDIAILGGMDLAGKPLTNGGRYDRATNSWSSIPPWQSEEAHEYGVAALVDGEIFVWGGRNGAVLTATGERYLP